MVNQILDLVTLSPSNCSGESDSGESDSSQNYSGERSGDSADGRSSHPDQLPTVLVPASKLHEGQQVLHNGTLLKVRRVVPAFTRPQACHIHLVPPSWQPLVGVSQQLADRDEATVLIRVACPTRKPFQVVA